MAELADQCGFDMATSSNGHTAYVADRATEELMVDREARAITERVQLDFTPHKIVWLGLSPSSYHAH